TEPYFAFMDVWAEIQNDANSVTPEGNAADIGVADIEASSRLKAVRGRQVVDLTVQLLSYDLLTATYWLDVRKTLPAASRPPLAPHGAHSARYCRGSRRWTAARIFRTAWWHTAS